MITIGELKYVFFYEFIQPISFTLQIAHYVDHN